MKKQMTEEKKENHQYKMKVSQKAIIYNPKDKKFLIVKLKDTTGKTDFYKSYGPWEFVGGRIEEGEDMIESFSREIKEETGNIKFNVIDAVITIKVDLPGGSTFGAGYLVEYISGEIKLTEHIEYRWETAEDIEKNKEYKPWLKDFIRKAVRYIESENSLDNWKRCQADLENYKKDEARRIGEFRDFVKADFVMQILPVLDNFHASTGHIPEDKKNNGWVEGIMHIQKQLEKVLNDNGVEEIKVKVGDEFKPEMHEAISEANATNKLVNATNKIEKIVRKGYKIGEKVIRAAKVVVS